MPVVRVPARAPAFAIAVMVGAARIVVSPGADEATLRTLLRALGATA